MNKKIIAYIVIGIIALGAGIFGFLYYNTHVTISAVPANAKITLSDQNLNNGERTKIKPGTYELKIELDDYIPYQQTVKLGIGANKLVSVSLRLLPVPEKVVNDMGKFAVLSVDKKSLFFLSNGGQTLFQIPDILVEKLTTEKISPDFFTGVTGIIWSPDRNLAIIKQDQKTSLYDFKRYDLLHQEITPFSDGIKNIVWSADSSSIIYYFAPSSGETTLIKATKTNTNEERIFNFKDTKIKNPQLDWSPDMLSVSIVANNELNIFDIYSKQLTTADVGKKVTEAKFTPDNNIIFVSDDAVYTCDKTGGNLQKHNFLTNLNKVSFVDPSNLIIAEKQGNNYSFFAYNLIDDVKTELVYNKKVQTNPINEILTTDGKNLYFESSGFLYRMKVDEGGY